MATSTEGIIISDVRLTKPSHRWKRNPKRQIVITYGSETRTSKFRKGDSCITWDESFFLAGENTLLTFTVRKKRYSKETDSCEHRVIDLLEMQNSSGSCKLDIAENCQLTFKIEKSPDVVSIPVQRALVASGNLLNLEVPAEAANFITSAVQVYKDNEEMWSLLLDKLEVFVELIDNISEISPFAKVAWSVLSVIPKTIIAKKNRDDKIRQLCGKLKDVYDYITDAKRLHELTATQYKTLLAVVLQTTECAYFLQAYCSTEHTVKNIVKGIIGTVDGTIQDFNDKFDRLMQAMRDSINLEINIITLRVKEEVSESTGWNFLKDMRYSGSTPLPGKRCLLGTREALIEDILKHINDDASPQILVLSGQAGIGKSTMAHTIAGLFKEQNRLGSMFCFDRSSPSKRNCLFSTISRDLADGDASWRKELVEVIKLNTAVRESGDPETQFNELIIKPFKKVATIGPVVIVVDALDESGDRKEREKILEILLSRWSELSKNYRMMVTTRPEQDIEAQCQKLKIPCKRMGDVDVEETYRDIEAYVSKRLESISSILDSIDRDWRNILAERAEGLFQWAHTACQFIDPTITRSDLVKKNWETCVPSSSLSLFQLYRQIISAQSESKYPKFINDFKFVVSAIITAQKPLSIEVLQNIFDSIEDIKSLLTPFGSFFVGVHDLSTPVRPVHTSLLDFFLSKETAEGPNEYYVDTSNQTQMTLACLKVMNQMLCFNICQLETSHLSKWDVPDINSRVEKAIPLHLQYSCQFWTFHLQFSPASEELIGAVRAFMDDKLMYYFEALSLPTWDMQGCIVMQEIVDWCKDVDNNLAEDAMDAWEFWFEFEHILRESTPHLYLSALPFAPRDSFVSRKYLEKYPGLVTFDVGQPVSSSRKNGFTRKDAFVWYPVAFAFSPKGGYYATGSFEGGFYVWNYVTREREFRHTGHSNHCGRRRVCDIVFSPDGELVYCCYEDGNILILNMGTKETRVEGYEKIVGAECRYCAISSDGRFIVWQTEKEALVFDRKSGQIIKRFEDGYRLSAISPNGNWIALHSRANEAYIWNTREQTQHVVLHYAWGELTLSDSCVSFKENSHTIVIWDVRTNTKVRKIQHCEDIESFRLSPDDQYILVTLTGLDLYEVYSVPTRVIICRISVDDLACGLTFSHDSKLIALCTFRHTIHVEEWDKSEAWDKPVEPRYSHSDENRRVYANWLRGSYLILWYRTVFSDHRLRISDITTTNTIIFEAELVDNGHVSVSPDEKNVRVAYTSSCGLCLWDDQEGEIVVDGSPRSITALVCSDKYLISGHEISIYIWDSFTRKLIRGPVGLQHELKSLLPVRGTCFAVIYGDKAEVRECESGDKVGETFTFKSMFFYPPIAVSVNAKHVICMSKNGLDIMDPTGSRVGSFPFPLRDIRAECLDSTEQLSSNGKYLAWIDVDNAVKLFDVDTETLLTGPSFNRSVRELRFSEDSNCLITLSGQYSLRKNGLFVDIWDIQSRNTANTISIPRGIQTLAMSNRCLVGHSNPRLSQCYVWDLDAYETMSNLYNAPPLAANDLDIAVGTPLTAKTEILDYALVAWGKGSFVPFCTIYPSGWVLGLRYERLFWVPPKFRERLWLPCMMHMPHQNIIKLNFNNFVHGTSWTKCRFSNN